MAVKTYVDGVAATKPTASLSTATDRGAGAASNSAVSSQLAVKTYVDGVATTKPTASLSTATDLGAGAASNSAVSSQLAVKTYVDTVAATKPTASLDTNTSLTANSDTAVPSQKAVKTYVDALAATKPTATLDTNTSLTANSDTAVPSQKAVKTYVDAVAAASVAGLNTIADGTVVASAANFTPDASVVSVFKVTVMGASSVAIALPSNLVSGKSRILTFYIEGDGTADVTFTGYTWPSGVVPVKLSNVDHWKVVTVHCVPTGAGTFEYLANLTFDG